MLSTRLLCRPPSSAAASTDTSAASPRLLLLFCIALLVLVHRGCQSARTFSASTIYSARAEFLPSLIAKYVNATWLDLSVCPRIDDRTVSFLMSRSYAVMWFGRLKEVMLVRTTTGLRQVGLEMLIRACGKLESVDVSHCLEFGDRECTSLALGGGLRKVTNESLRSISSLQKLEDLGMVCPVSGHK